MADGDPNHIAITITSFIDDIPDPRLDRSRLHSLSDIILLTLVGLLAGADNWVHIELFGKTNEDFLRQFLRLENGVPSHDTLGRVFRMLDPEELGSRLAAWLDAIRTDKAEGHIAVDGKTLRRSLRSQRCSESLRITLSH